jgi:hypothetical protein
MTEYNANKAKRVLVSLLSSLNHLMPMSKKIFFKLFHAKIVPILLYGSEICGLDYIYIIMKKKTIVNDTLMHPYVPAML